VNTGAPWPEPEVAWTRVLGIQTKLQQWAADAPNRRFCDLYNLVCDPAVLFEAWRRVRGTTRGSTNQSLTTMLHRLNPVLRGWTNYFRYGVSKATFSYFRAFTWRRVICWIRHKHGRIAWKELRRRYLSGWWPREDEVPPFDPSAVAVSRYRYRADRIPTPWATMTGRDAA
jgi:hypothetical protein